MYDIDSWNDDALLTKYLAGQLIKGRLALFLGAGISKDFIGVTWPELVQRILEAKGETFNPGTSFERQIARLRTAHFASDTEGYLNLVRDELYRTFDLDVSFEKLRTHKTLGALGALVMASKRGGVSKVVTLNYDDLLEVYLEFHGFVTASVHQELHWQHPADVVIYHPHGFLPSRTRLPKSDDIVLDQISYGKIIGKDGSPWRQVIMSTIRTHTCLFIGLSGEDMNFVSLLEDANKTHAIRSGSEDALFWGLTATTSKDPGDLDLWKAQGVYPKLVADFTDDLPAFLFRICQQAANLRLEQMGI